MTRCAPLRILLPVNDILLSVSQREALNKAPLIKGTRNKVKIALGIVGASQGDLARATGMDAGSISNIANGKYERIALDTCQRIARVLGIDCVDELFPMEHREAA